jgi:effector-binding domain-containing protein
LTRSCRSTLAHTSSAHHDEGAEVVAVEYEIVDLEPQTTVVVRGSVPVAELPGFFQRAYGIVFHALAEHGIEPIGEPFGYYPSEPSDVVDVEAGVVVGEACTPGGEACASLLPGGRVVVATHVGPYDTLERTYRELLAEIESGGLVRRPVGVWEQYLTDPESEPDASRWRTRIHVPIEP